MAVVKTFLVTVIFALIYESKSESVPWTTNQQEWLEHTKKGVRLFIWDWDFNLGCKELGI